MIQTTPYFDDFVNYYAKAKLLQEECNLGGKPYVGAVGDDLMELVTIYDTVDRRYAGFSNMIQDLWLGSSNPKFYKQSDGMKRRTMSYDKQHSKWFMYEWAYVFFVHRLTGSGASFESDHGYRNTILPNLAYISLIPDMVDYIRGYENPMFTSIGNQIPPFPKPQDGYKTGGKYYLCELAPELIKNVMDFACTTLEVLGEKITIREVVDYMVAWHHDRGLRAFHFVFTAFAADLADYMPELVEEGSHMYYGKNAKECMDLLATPTTKMNKDAYYDAVMHHATQLLKSHPKDLEDVMCDYIRYVENYIPDNRERTYAHLDRNAVYNSSAIRNHPKGRQRGHVYDQRSVDAQGWLQL